MKGELSPLIILEVEDLFKKKNWSIVRNATNDVSLYNRFCARLRFFDENGQRLMIKLANNYKQFPLNDYVESFLMSFFCFDEVQLKLFDNYVIVPLIQPYLVGEEESNESNEPISTSGSKSANFLHYLLKASDLSWVDYLSSAHFIDKVEDLKKYWRDKTMVIFVDDFIGSGETAINVLKDYFGKVKAVDLNNSNVKIVTIASQEIGIQRIREVYNVDVYCHEIRRRGISDSFPNEEVPDLIERMKSMEKKSGCNSRYSLGYSKSEALVTMLDKTPNNTFPVFWHETATKAAPFPRYRKSKRKNGK